MTGAIDQAIEEGHRQRRVAKVIAPGFEVGIGHQRGAAMGIVRFDHLVEQIGGLRTVQPFQFSKPNSSIINRSKLP